MTTDRVSVVARYGADGPRFALRNLPRWSIGSDDGRPEAIYTDEPVTGFRGAGLRKNISGGTLYADAYTNVGPPSTVKTDGTYTSFTFSGFNFAFDFSFAPGEYASFPAELDGVAGRATCTGCAFESTPGQLKMTRGSMTFTPEDGSGPTILGTDTRTDPDADYLMAGTWLFVPGNASGTADYEFGAFADGSDPFEQTGFAWPDRPGDLRRPRVRRADDDGERDRGNRAALCHRQAHGRFRP